MVQFKLLKFQKLLILSLVGGVFLPVAEASATPQASELLLSQSMQNCRQVRGGVYCANRSRRNPPVNLERSRDGRDVEIEYRNGDTLEIERSRDGRKVEREYSNGCQVTTERSRDGDQVEIDYSQECRR